MYIGISRSRIAMWYSIYGWSGVLVGVLSRKRPAKSFFATTVYKKNEKGLILVEFSEHLLVYSMRQLRFPLPKIPKAMNKKVGV